MDWQYFPHKHIIDLERLFSYKNTALQKLKSMGLDCPFVSSNKSYEQLYLDEVQKDFNCDESEYLKEGIVCIFECLKVVENEIPLTEDVLLKLFLKDEENIKLFERLRKQKGFGEKEEANMISQMLDEKNKREQNISANSVIALSRELAEFKVRLSRRGIETVIEDDEIIFLDVREPIPEPKYDMIDNIEHIDIYKPLKENPYPKIFRDDEAFALFEKLHSIYKDVGNLMANYSFIYRMMYKDGSILETVKPNKFIELIMEKPYEIEYLPKLKSYAEVCENKAEKLSIYNFLKNA